MGLEEVQQVGKATGREAVAAALRLRHSVWRLIHNGLAAIVVMATVIHALQIEGAMEPGSKWMLCMAVVAATGVALLHLRVVRPFRAWRERGPRRGAKRALPKTGVG